ncbi:hypothetical protein SISNIDRAFT_450506 [Sistotremastrum niveocremeum HHB9708]|uniref:Uncharacterized protein n=2 Tax=Sistotremastraceae TaxID=3402574 RepID=A0A164YC02_9AGAM|nr:hypothetical protein SISNIDRAFT_450506 [Sistotremastrum niveocremeum HHB9708]KZT40197.1 hypothetical protein SISSUDRAFT_1044640 [Sistotremastrum suecicum HHB10207 ss-3]
MRLPAELVIHIVVEVIAPTPPAYAASSSNLDSQHPLLPDTTFGTVKLLHDVEQRPCYVKPEFERLRLVCRSWNNIIVSDARLWTYISMIRKQDIPWARRAAERSKGLPVSLVMGGVSIKKEISRRTWMEAAQEMIKSLLDRTFHLVLSLDWDDLSLALGTWASCRAPCLRSLLIYMSDGFARSFGQLPPFFSWDMPQLESLAIHAPAMIWSYPSPFPLAQLKQLRIEVNSDVGQAVEHTLVASERLADLALNIDDVELTSNGLLRKHRLRSVYLCSPFSKLRLDLAETRKISSSIVMLDLRCMICPRDGKNELLLEFLGSLPLLEVLQVKTVALEADKNNQWPITPRKMKGLHRLRKLSLQTNGLLPFMLLWSFDLENMDHLTIDQTGHWPIRLQLDEENIPSLPRFPCLTKLEVVALLSPRSVLLFLHKTPSLRIFKFQAPMSANKEFIQELSQLEAGRNQDQVLCPSLEVIKITLNSKDPEFMRAYKQFLCARHHRWRQGGCVKICFQRIDSVVGSKLRHAQIPHPR